MKKTVRKITAVVVMCVMTLTLVACGGATDEQKKQMDDLMNSSINLVSSLEKLVETYPKVEGNPQYDGIVAANKTRISTLKAQNERLKKTYDEEKGSCSKEDAETVIKSLKSQVQSLSSLQTQLVTDISAVKAQLKKEK